MTGGIATTGNPATWQLTPQVQTGWICPHCNVGVSPFVDTCPCRRTLPTAIMQTYPAADSSGCPPLTPHKSSGSLQSVGPPKTYYQV